MNFRPELPSLNRRRIGLLGGGLALLAAVFAALPAHAADEAPDAMIRRLSVEVLEAIKSDQAVQSGDFNRVIALVDAKIMPNVNFQRVTASAVGPAWREATPEQRTKLQDAFKILLVRTYSGALNQVDNQQVVVRPLRGGANDKEVLVRTEIRGGNEPVPVDYRMEKTPGEGAGWKIYDLNVVGVWLVETYRGQFASEINARGIDGLIAALNARNQTNAGKS
jgi:phospholipid transport system substrate-binding protein